MSASSPSRPNPCHRAPFSIGLALAGLFSACPWASAQTEKPADAPTAAPEHPFAAEREREVWRKAVMTIPRPHEGCFTANYPERAWRETACKPSTPHKMYLPQVEGMSRLDIVGGAGPDISAVVTGNITEAEGSFDSVTGVTSTGTYTLQLNTAPFSSATCNTSPNAANCSGWEQFVYDSSGTGFIQYWLLRYAPAGNQCPMPRHNNCQAGRSYSDGWCPFQFSPTGDVYCVINASNEANAPSQPMTALGQFRLRGATPGVNGSTNDAITVTVGATPYTASGNNRLAGLDTAWNEAEFNVFGDGNSSQATFNSGSNLVVRTEVISGSNAGPGCRLRSWTGESTNLTLANTAPVSPSPTPGPALVFAQSNPAPAGALASCADAVSIGDTHLTTFQGLPYDFQAVGDFLLAQTGPDFQVQTRQKSGAPSWPDAAVNKAVAVLAGKNRIAICLPERVMVDGRPVSVPEGRSMRLSKGGYLLRNGNVYSIWGPSGDSVRATLNGTYIDVSVGLGSWPNPHVQGLLANARSSANEVAARDGRVLRSPFAFEALYGHYTSSWRVAPRESMLSACGEALAPAVPRKPFFAKDLGRQVSVRSRAVCLKAGVKEGPLLEDCTLDVAVIGPRAAQVFVRRPAPVVINRE